METPLETLDRWWRVARARIAALVVGRRLDAEVEEELAFHSAMAQAEAEARGASPSAARLEARRRLDGVALRRDECRDARGLAWLDAVRQDTRHAWRGLRRTPAYTGVAIASLSLGLGAIASLFAVVDAVLVRPLPLPDASRVVWIEEIRNGEASGGSPKRLDDWRGLDSITAAGGFYGDEPFVRTTTGDLGRLPAVRTFGALYETMGLPTIQGRLPTAAEQRGEGGPVVLLTERSWRNRFHARADVVGMTVRVDRAAAEVIGVLPAAIESLADAELWMPAPPELQASSRLAGFLGQVARLAPGRSLVSAQAEFAAAAATLAKVHPDTDRGLGVQLLPLRTRLGQDARRPLLLLLGTVALVLLVVCLNVASLTLVRGLGRLRDASLRVAIGAGRARLLQLYLFESAIVATGGTVLGLAVAWFGVDGLRLLLPAMPGLPAAALDVRVIAATSGVATLSMLLVGVLPAVLAWRAAAAPTLRDGGHAVSGLARGRARSLLVVVQVAAAVVLLVGTGLLARTLASLRQEPLGFEPAHTLTLRVPLAWDSEPARIAEVTAQVLARLEAAPGVAAAGVADRLPLGGGSQSTKVAIAGIDLPPDLAERAVGWRTVGGRFFAAIGQPVRRGVALPARWATGEPRVAVVNERFVRLFLGGRDPIGVEVSGYRRAKERAARFRIIGVVGDVRTAIDEPAPPSVYVPAGATYWPLLHVAARVDGDPMRLIPVVRTLASELAPDVTIEDVAPLDARVSDALGEPRTRTWIVGGFAAITVLLAAIGLYGLLAGEVAARVREIGIRLVLGAAPRQVMVHMLRRGLGLAAVGVSLGLVAAPIAGRLIEGMLAGRPSRDWVAVAGASAVLLGVSVLASLGPAWRAARIDPNRALRTE